MFRSQGISHLIYCPFNEPYYLDVVDSIAKKIQMEDKRVIVFQPASPIFDLEFYSSKILNLFNKTEPGIFFARKMSNLGIVVVNDSRSSNSNVNNSQKLLNDEEYQLSLNSSLISFFRDSGPFNTQRQKRKKRRYEKIALNVFQQTLDIIEDYADITDIYIPNGRFVDQKAFSLAAQSLKPEITKHYFERGFSPNMYYLGSNSLHDRVSIQREISNFSEPRFIVEATEWFNSRKTNRNVNEFVYRWRTEAIGLDSNGTRKLAILFNSSNDEFVSLGPLWNDSAWKSQWEAFSIVAERLLNLGYEIVVRLHPNGLNKSRREKKREKEQIKSFKNLFPGVKVYDPGEQINSYFLIQQADLVVVWNSTIGLEASHMGKSVVCLNAAEWDRSVPVLCVKSLQDLAKLEIDQQILDFTLPAKFISGRMEMDSQLLSDFYSIYFKKLENSHIAYRLAKYLGAAKPFDFKVIIKVLFVSQDNWIYRSLRKVNHKLKTLG